MNPKENERVSLAQCFEITGILERLSGLQSLALAGGVMAILVMNIRNNFLFVPGQVFIVIVLWYIGKWIGRRSPYEAPPKL